jgi:predicted RNase H-like nuclease (RuvC/YqgF family)
MSKELVDHIIEMKEVLHETKAKTEQIHGQMEAHIDLCERREGRIDKLAEEMANAKGSVKALKWALGILLTIAGVAAKLMH